MQASLQAKRYVGRFIEFCWAHTRTHAHRRHDVFGNIPLSAVLAMWANNVLVTSLTLDCTDKPSTRVKVPDLADYVKRMTETVGFGEEFKVPHIICEIEPIE